MPLHWKEFRRKSLEQYLYSNFLDSSIPNEIGAFTKLSVLNLFNNALDGYISSGIGALMTLAMLYL
jgi:hypothetical protein